MASANAASGLSIVVFMDSRYAETRNPARRKYRHTLGFPGISSAHAGAAPRKNDLGVSP
jgi:hypothetical protein